jgi:drug/metabolite transporter (DMT)-like permease
VSTVAVALLTFATFPVFTSLLEPLLPGERLEAATLAAAVVTVAGVALVVPSTDAGDPVVRGAFWGIVSGATFALLSVANRGLVRRHGALTLAFQQDLWAAVALVPFVLSAPRAPTPTEWALLVVLGTIFTAAAHALFIHGLSGVRAGRAAVIAALEPVYGVAMAALLLGERPGGRVLVGGGIVLATAVWVSGRSAASGGAGPGAPG